MNHSFAMQVTMKAFRGRGDELTSIMVEASELVSNLSGCQAYIVIRGMTEPDHVMITEIWDSQEAHQASLSNPEVMKLINAARPLLDQMQHHVGRPLSGLNHVLRPICA